MEQIRSALVVGAGAVGLAVASIISARKPGGAAILAGGERLKRYRHEGFVVNGRPADFPFVAADQPPWPGEEPDLVIVAVKCHHLERAIEDMRAFVGPRTLVLSLLNGISSEDALAAAFGREKVPYAMILGIDAVREGNSTTFSAAGKIHFGDARNASAAWSERVSRIAAFFDLTGVGYVVPEDMIRSMWYKLMINVGINQASAVLRESYGLFQRSAEAWHAMESAMRELIEISRRLGTGLLESDLDAWRGTLMSLSPGAKTSMLQDIEAGRKTEVEAFALKVIELGEATGVPTPVNRLLYDLIKAMEQQA